MRRYRFLATAVMAGMMALATVAPSAVARGQAPSAPATGAGATAGGGAKVVMTRGPIHEAFAQPVHSGQVTPLVVPKKPPEPIEEVPPDVKPADEKAIWIGGYWAWNDDRKDFDWVSGVWRVPPPGERWVAGYWSEAAGGYSWVPGFWTAAEGDEVSYYPEPPTSLEKGPTSAPPSPDHLWISGCWRWIDSRYAWQPGYWTEAQPDWVWIPASYYWSPRGWIFCDGYWDYRFERRGMIFAPVYFPSAIYGRPGYSYSPSVVLDAALLTFYLFVRPSYGHYYFGDYYAAGYDNLGIYPWFAVRGHPGYAYDPLFTYYGWRNRSRDPDWAKNLQDWHAYYRSHPDKRLPHDLASAQRVAAEAEERPEGEFLKIADTLQNLRSKPDASTSLASVSAEQKSKFHETSQLMRRFKEERGRMETAAEPRAAERAGESAPGTAAKAPDAAAELPVPEKLRLPKGARTPAESARTRPEESVRRTLKPVVPTLPAPPARHPEAPAGEVRGPSAVPELPRGNVAPQGLRERQSPIEVRPEGHSLPPRAAERGERGSTRPQGGGKGAERGDRGRR